MFCVLLAWVLLDARSRSAVGPGERRRLLSGQASEITSLTSEAAGGAPSVVAAKAGGRWTVMLDGDAWPADERRVQAGLRLISAAEVEPSEAGPASADFVCTIASGEGRTRVEFGPPALSGMRGVLQEGEPGRVAREVGDLLAPASLRAWSSGAVFPELDAGVVAIRLSGDRTIRLARVGSRWGLTEPIRTAADPAAVARLIAELAGLTAAHEELPDDANTDSTTIEIESSESSWRLVVREGGSGRAGFESRVAEFHRGVRGLNRADLGKLFDVDALVSRLALDLPASDIQAIIVGGGDTGTTATIERSGRGWLSDGEAAAQLLDLLTNSEAESAQVEQPQPGATRVQLVRFGDLPAASCTLWLVGSSLHVSDGFVTRVYPESATAAVRDWLLRLGG